MNADSKPCEICATTMTRRKKWSYAEWNSRRFCSPACMAVAWADKSKRNRRPETYIEYGGPVSVAFVSILQSHENPLYRMKRWEG